jgi:hypothetical protein
MNRAILPDSFLNPLLDALPQDRPAVVLVCGKVGSGKSCVGRAILDAMAARQAAVLCFSLYEDLGDAEQQLGLTSEPGPPSGWVSLVNRMNAALHRANHIGITLVVDVTEQYHFPDYVRPMGYMGPAELGHRADLVFQVLSPDQYLWLHVLKTRGPVPEPLRLSFESMPDKDLT